MAQSSKRGHTKGPYLALRIGDTAGNIRRVGFVILTEDGKTCIANTPTTYVHADDRDAEGPSLAELTANAKLLAASSEMFDALGEIERLMRQMAELHPTRCGEVLPDPAGLATRIRMLRAKVTP